MSQSKKDKKSRNKQKPKERQESKTRSPSKQSRADGEGKTSSSFRSTLGDHARSMNQSRISRDEETKSTSFRDVDVEQGLISQNSNSSMASSSRNVRRAGGKKERKSRKKYQIYQAKQYQMLFTLMLIIFANSMSIFSFGHVNALCVEVFYEVQGVAVGRNLTIVFLLMYPFGTMLTNLIVYARGMKLSLNIGGFLTTLGYLCRYASLYFPEHTYQRYNIILTGQILLGFAQPMFLNVITKLANNWYDIKERDWAVKYLYASHPIGMVAGLVLSLRAMPLGCGSGIDFQFVYFIQSLIALLAWLMSWCFENTPPTPPSQSNELMLRESDKDALDCKTVQSLIKYELSWLLQNPNFVWLSAAFACLYALTYGLLIAVAETQVLEDEYGYSSQKQAPFAVALLIGGLMGCFVYGLAVTLYGYHPVRKIGYVFLIFALGFADVWLRAKTDASVAFFIFGSFSIPLIPVCLETAAELTYNIPEQLSSGFLFSVGTLGTIGMFVLIEVAIGNPESAARSYKLVAMLITLLGCTFSFLTYGIYQRTKHDEPITQKEEETSPFDAT